MPDISKVKISEMIAYAEQQAEIEKATVRESELLERDASWQSTLEMLRLMKDRGVPDRLRAKERGRGGQTDQSDLLTQ